MRVYVTWTLWLSGPVMQDDGEPRVPQEELRGNAFVDDVESTVEATAKVLGDVEDSTALMIAERELRGEKWTLGGVVMSAVPCGSGPEGEAFNLEAKRA
jgi:hypothetical protein